MSAAETPPASLEVAVKKDGTITVPADKVARLGLWPGARVELVLVPVGEAEKPAKRKSLRGALAHLGPGPSGKDFEKASAVATADLEARYKPGGRWGPSVGDT